MNAKDEYTKDGEKTEAWAALLACAKELVRGWEGTGFYDRQDPAPALALHDALRNL